MSKKINRDSMTGLEVAVIGMAGRFPGAENIEEFWENLVKGVESIRFFSDDELKQAGTAEEMINRPNYVKANGFVEGVDRFDAPFFDYTPEEAGQMDPQVRIFHECVQTALEDVGIVPETYQKPIGVFAGASDNFYWQARAHLLPGARLFQSSDKDFLCSHVSYKLDLQGPSSLVQTACSTSLVAVHQACRALLTGDCKVALAGGVSAAVPQERGYLHQEGLVYSPDGHCRAFDARAGGTVGGSGAAVVVLKLLKEAVADRDHIYAIVKGTAVNNDGRRKVGYAAPSVEGQAEVIKTAMRMARVEPGSIGYIETHGTATQLGDMVEIGALRLAFNTEKRGFCALGSVKTNIGHLDCAAGIASLVKAVLCLQRRLIPANLHFETPNPQIDFENSPFYVNSRPAPWHDDRNPRRAGVSAFGIGGTNAHVILEEAPGTDTGVGAQDSVPLQDAVPRLILLSARSESALARMIGTLGRFFKKNPAVNLADAAYTLQTGRKNFPHRAMLVCRDGSEAAAVLSTPQSDQLKRYIAPKKRPSLVFMFSGQGTQYVGMGLALYHSENVFRREMERCFEILKPLLGVDAKEILYPSHMSNRFYKTYIDRPEIAQPILFAFEYALARQLMEWGIEPYAMIGYSIGEYAAACLAGVFSLEDGAALVAHRGRLMAGLPEGAMLSVPLPEEELLPLIADNDDLSLAVDNGPTCIIAGLPPAVEDFQALMKKRKIFCMKLNIGQAGHSQGLESIVAEFADRVEGVALSPPRIPCVSTVSGDWIRDEQAVDPAYWAAHIRSTVRFSRGLEKLFSAEDAVFLEVGPGKALSNFARQKKDKESGHLVLNLIRDESEEIDDRAHLLDRLGRLWLYGLDIGWHRFYREEKRSRVSLPTYPFEEFKYPVAVDLSRLASALAQDREISRDDSEAPTPQPSVRLERPELITAFVPASTPTEETLAAIWQRFFGIGRVGIADDFFELGGDSLKAMALADEIYQKLHVRTQVRSFFSFPTIRTLSAWIDGALKERPYDKYESIQPLEEREYYPLSPAQKRTYILHKLSNEGTAYNEPSINPLKKSLEREKVEIAFKKLIERHESLRTSFMMVEGEPVQRVHKAQDIEFAVEYYETVISNQLSVFSDFIRPFDFSRPPLLRVGLIQYPGDSQALLLDIHHIAADGTSLKLLQRDFMTLYDGGSLAPLRIRYKDYTGWLNKKEIRESLLTQEEYWKKRFAGDIPVLNLPLDHARPAVQGFAGDTFTFILDREKSRQVGSLAAGQGATVYMVLLAVFNILLAKLSMQGDIVVGTPVVGRRHADLHPIIGMFVNTLAMRNFPGQEKSFEVFLKEVKESTLEAYDNQEFQFEELVERVEVARDLSRNPLFDVMFGLQNQAEIPPGLAEGGDAQVSVFAGSRHDTSKFDLAFYGVQVAECIHFQVEYCTLLFKEESVRRFVRYFERIISQVAVNPRQSIADIDILDDEEKAEILQLSQGPRQPFDEAASICQLFDDQAARTPDRVAVVGPQPENHSISYRELNEKSDRLARLLGMRGVGVDTVVGMCADRSCELVVGILGILNAGGVCLPIDSDYPQERIDYMLADSGARILLTTSNMIDQFQGRDRFKTCPYNVLIDICRGDPTWSPEILSGAPINDKGSHTGLPLHSPSAASLLYIIYTSGSTGRPKGVMLEHKNLINLIDYQYRCTAIDFNRVLQYAPIGFDVSFQEIFSTLLAGGRLYMLEKEIRADLDKLVHMIRKHEIKTLFFPAALVKVLSTLTNTMEPIPGCVEHLVAAGEQLVVPQEFARCLESRLVSLHNHYGPSETHVVTTFTMAPEADKPRLPAIGRPIANSALFIVDAGGRLQPEGAQGEICIAGRQVGRGYLNNPEMTAERFITAPAFSQQPWVGAQNVVPLQSSMTEPGRPHGVAPTNCKLTTDNCKLYKTGDLGRYLSDGNIGFLGRVDHQVKIRGFRVEPGEIESQLLNHPDIIEAAVMLRADNRSEPYLCAYIVDVVGAAPRGRPGNKAISKEGTEALREFLSRSLPDYMIPARFVRLEKIPLSPNGKVDRRALPEPGVEAGPEYVAPGNETEEALAEIWSQVLGIETDRIGMESNFFDLGGHSLRATVMAAKLQKEFGIDVSLAEIFRKPTIRGIATMIQTINWVKNQELLGGDEIDEFVL